MTSEQRKVIEAVQNLRHCPTVSTPEVGFVKIPESMWNTLVRRYDEMIIEMGKPMSSGIVMDPGGTAFRSTCGRLV